MDFTIFKQKFVDLLNNSTYGGYADWHELGEYWESPSATTNTSEKGLHTIQSYVKGCCDVIRRHMVEYQAAPVGHYTNRDILYCIMNDSSDYAVSENDKTFWRLLKEIYFGSGSVVDDSEYLSVFTITFDEANKNNWDMWYGVENLPYVKQEIYNYLTDEYSGTSYVNSTPVWKYDFEFNGPEGNPVGPGSEYSGVPTDQNSPLLMYIYTKKKYATMNTFQSYSNCTVSDVCPENMSNAFMGMDIVTAPQMNL